MINPDFVCGVLPGSLNRFTEAQLNYYRSCGQSAEIRAACLSGAFIGVESKSKVIEIEFIIKGRARNYLGFDLEVDDRVIKSIRIDLLPEMEKMKLKLFQFPDEKTRKIKLYLPVSVAIEILSFSAEGQPLKSPEKKLLCLGDSITQGMDAVFPFCTFPVITAKILNADLINQGVGGQIFDEKTIDENFPFQPDIITVAYGVNDWYRDFTIEKIEKSVFSYLEKLKKVFHQSKIFVITPVWTNVEDQTKAAGNLQDVRNIIENIAQSTGCNVIDGLSLVPHNNFYFVDGIHPNETGHLIYGVNLANAIIKNYT